MGQSQPAAPEHSRALLRDNYVNINKTNTPTSDLETLGPFDSVNIPLRPDLLERHSIAKKIREQEIMLHPYVAQVIKRWEEHSEASFSIFSNQKQRTSITINGKSSKERRLSIKLNQILPERRQKCGGYCCSDEEEDIVSEKSVILVF